MHHFFEMSKPKKNVRSHVGSHWVVFECVSLLHIKFKNYYKNTIVGKEYLVNKNVLFVFL